MNLVRGLIQGILVSILILSISATAEDIIFVPVPYIIQPNQEIITVNKVNSTPTLNENTQISTEEGNFSSRMDNLTAAWAKVLGVDEGSKEAKNIAVVWVIALGILFIALPIIVFLILNGTEFLWSRDRDNSNRFNPELAEDIRTRVERQLNYNSSNLQEIDPEFYTCRECGGSISQMETQFPEFKGLCEHCDPELDAAIEKSYEEIHKRKQDKKWDTEKSEKLKPEPEKERGAFLEWKEEK